MNEMGCVRRRHLVAVVMAEFAADVSNLGFKNSPTRLTKVFALTIYNVVKPGNYWFLEWNFLHIRVQYVSCFQYKNKKCIFVSCLLYMAETVDKVCYI